MSHNYLKELIHFVKTEMKNKEINQVDLAKKMGLSRQTINQLLSGEHSPRLDTLINLSSAIDVPPFYLLMSKEDRDKWNQLHPGQALKAGPLNHLSSRENLIKAALHLTEEQCRFVVDHIFSTYALSPEEREQIASELLSSSETQPKKRTR